MINGSPEGTDSMEAALEQVNLRLTQHCVNNEEPSFQASNLHEISDHRQQRVPGIFNIELSQQTCKTGKFHTHLSEHPAEPRCDPGVPTSPASLGLSLTAFTSRHPSVSGWIDKKHVPWRARESHLMLSYEAQGH